ncbi:calcium/sodium antiporter [Tepidicaulis sp. LMO-SS28]|uniref:calcium/sodium antiporter n=1 Tax=Tepidicaulis sp. LMO-SS28 TaxID=3447455 RepID=UPI003EE2663B
MDYLLIAAGLVLLFAGGEVLVRSSVAIATRFGVSPVLVGLTIVAFGTSAPELTVSLEAALVGQPDIAIGNIVGSNIANILLILGLAAVITPLHPERALIVRDGIFMLAVTVGLAAICLTGMITPLQGWLFVGLLTVYICICYWAERKSKTGAAALHTHETEEYAGLPPRLYVLLPLFALGLAGVIFGAQLLVDGAIAIARVWGVPEAVIGLSMVAVGTSLPELVVSVIAAIRGRVDVAVGNVVGSNIANILGILGVTAIIEPLAVARQIATFDAWVMVFAAVILLPVMITGRKISRGEGAVFLVLFAAYITALYAGVPAKLAD